MKKYILIAMMTISAISFAGSSKEDIVEKRVKMEFKERLGRKVDIDVDIYGKDANVEIEYDGEVPKNIDVKKEAQEIADYILKDSEIQTVSVSFVEDPMIGEDKAVFTQIYKK